MIKSHLTQNFNGLINNYLSIKSFKIYFQSLFSSIISFNDCIDQNKASINRQSFYSFFNYPLIMNQNMYKALTQNGQDITCDSITNQLATLFSKENRKAQCYLISSILAIDVSNKEIIIRDDVILIFSFLDYESINQIKEIIIEAIPNSQTDIETLTSRAFNDNSDIFNLFISYLNSYAPFTIEDIEYFSHSSLETYQGFAKPTDKLIQFLRKRFQKNYCMNELDYDINEDSSNCSYDEDLNILDSFEEDLSNTISKVDNRKFSKKYVGEYGRISFSEQMIKDNIFNAISISSCNLLENLSDNSPIHNYSVNNSKHYSTNQLFIPKKQYFKTNQSLIKYMIAFSTGKIKLKKRVLILTHSSLIIEKKCNKMNNTTNDSFSTTGNISHDNCIQFEHIIPLHLIYAKNKGFNQQDKTSLPLIKIYSYHNPFFNDITIQLNNDKEALKLMKTINSASSNSFNINDYYDFVEKIGRGEYSEVFIARNKKTNERVAIKRLSKSLTQNQDISNDWEKDIFKYLIKVPHKNICRMINLYETASYIYYVTEFIKGVSLGKYLKDNSYSKSNEMKENLFNQIANGIDFLHFNGIIHRDIKPENILLDTSTDNITVKIIDFGFSKVIGKTETCNEGYGTLVYIAPEILCKIPYSFKVDIWSLGVIMYQTVFGQLPFGENCNNMKLIAKSIKEQNYEIPEYIINTESEDFIHCMISVINKCLGNSIQNRPMSIIDLLQK